MHSQNLPVTAAVSKLEIDIATSIQIIPCNVRRLLVLQIPLQTNTQHNSDKYYVTLY